MNAKRVLRMIIDFCHALFEVYNNRVRVFLLQNLLINIHGLI